MALETYVSFKGREFEKMVSLNVPLLDKEKKMAIVSISSNTSRKQIDVQSSILDSPVGLIQHSQLSDPAKDKHMAALKLQKVYKSFRTRRKLADCAVLVEQSWYVRYIPLQCYCLAILLIKLLTLFLSF